MSGKHTRWTPDDLKRLGLVANEKGDFVKVSSLVAKGKVKKIEPILIGNGGMMTDYQLDVIKKVENRKIKNATKIEAFGFVFDSRLEKYFYELLLGAQIDFNFQVEYLLQEKFKYGKEAIRAITLTCDFFLPEFKLIVDTKGFHTQQGTMRYKMLKWSLHQKGLYYKILMITVKTYSYNRIILNVLFIQ